MSNIGRGNQQQRSLVVSASTRRGNGGGFEEDGFEAISVEGPPPPQSSFDDEPTVPDRAAPSRRASGSDRAAGATNGSKAIYDGGGGPSSSFVCERNPETGGWLCVPYKFEALQAEIDAANDDDGRPPYEGIVNELRNQGVRVYIVGYDSADLMEDVLSVVDVVSRNDRNRTYREKQRCLLYRDEGGRVFNLKIRGNAAGLAGTWQSLLLSFSGFEAMVAMTVLARAFPCIDIDGVSGVRPGYLTLILGLVLAEEIGQVMVNVGMLVQGRPSVSAYALKSHLTTDWPRKLIVFSLAIASAAPTDSLTQRWITFAGILMAELVLTANLGSRAWYNLQLNPLKYGGFFAPAVAFLLSVLAGLTVPYMGHRQVQAGGKAAMEAVIRSAVFVAVVFVLSDIDEVQQFIVVGSEICSQDGVNIGVGIWFAVTLVTSAYFVMKMKPHRIKPEESEPILEEDHASPVGFKVPGLPDVSIDPDLNKTGYPCCALKLEFALGVILALAIGGVIVFTGYTDMDDELLNREIYIP